MNSPVPGFAARAQALSRALPAARAAGELWLAYQPQVCLTSGRIVGVEALLRWTSPAFGEVSPVEFVPVAENTGQIQELGAWVLATACADAARWRGRGLPPVRVGVNVSALQFGQADVVAAVRRVLAQAGLPPQALAIEVTESALLHDVDSVAGALRQLQADGIEIALDDFGTGYSSLSRLRDLPIDLVKIDRSFVHDVAAAASAASVTRSVIHLAHELHLRVLAEGVETDEQLRLLVANGCDQIQGWVFSKGIPADAFADMLAEGRALPRELTHRHTHERTLLLVDDEPNIISALKRLFRRDGYKLLTAGSGAEALALLAAQHVDVIVTDQRMPGMTGVEFLHRAKELYPDTIRMTLSGYTELQSIIDAVNQGAVYKFLTKPWEDSRLREHVAQAFSVSELAKENRRLTNQIGVTNTELAEANRRLEHLVARQQERAHVMAVAAGGARDLVDLIPLAVFGFDTSGVLAYVNRCARETFPDWAADLGSEPARTLRELRGEASAAAAEGVVVSIGGEDFAVWHGVLGGCDAAIGQVLMLQRAGSWRDGQDGPRR